MLRRDVLLLYYFFFNYQVLKWYSWLVFRDLVFLSVVHEVFPGLLVVVQTLEYIFVLLFVLKTLI